MKMLINQWERKIKELRLSQKVWFAKNEHGIAESLEHKIQGISECITDLKKLNQGAEPQTERRNGC